MEQLLIALWLLCGVLVFLPVGTAFRFARRGLAVLPLFGEDTNVILPVSEDPAPSAATDLPPTRGAPLIRNRPARLLLMLTLYVAFVSGAVYYTPKFLSHTLDTPYPMAAVTSSSMWPTLRKGDLVVLKGVDKLDDVHVGDIIAFRHESGFAIHRVVDIEGTQITTQGDANDIKDPPIGIDAVVGRVARVMGHIVRVPYLGNIPLMMHREAETLPAESPPTFEGQEGVEAPGGQ